MGWPFVNSKGEEVRLEVCPLPKVPGWWGRMLSLWKAATRGVYFRPGGMEDQPRWYLLAVAFVDSAITEFRNRRLKREAEAPPPTSTRTRGG